MTRPRPAPAKSNQETAWAAANPLLAELSTARIRELQAEQSRARQQYAQACADERVLRSWIASQRA